MCDNITSKMTKQVFYGYSKRIKYGIGSNSQSYE